MASLAKLPDSCTSSDRPLCFSILNSYFATTRIASFATCHLPLATASNVLLLVFSNPYPLTPKI